MINSKRRTLIFLLLIPVIILLWSLYLIHISGPFFLSRIDPEYPYLLNGLNCARLRFSLIGIIEHPGTPFEMLTGVFIRLTHLFTGQGPISEDVITRPEVYLSAAAFLLTLFSVAVLLWLGKIAYQATGSVFSSMVLQSSLFLGMVLIDMSKRYIPDRFMVYLVLILCGLCFKYLYRKNCNSRKFAVLSAIVVGIGVVTKIHFFPFLLLPLALISTIRNRIIYALTFLISAVISFLPIQSKYVQFRNFITQMITNDGLYGSGKEQIINAENFIRNIGFIIEQNISFIIVFCLSLAAVLLFLFKPQLRKKHHREFILLIAFQTVIFFGFALIAKHFKNYYVIPFTAMTAFIFLILYQIARANIKFRFLPHIAGLFLFILICIPASKILPLYKHLPQNNMQNKASSLLIKEAISNNGFLFVEPTWLSGPYVENGLVLGLTYVAHSHEYYNIIERYFPHVITWEGDESPMKYFRMPETDNEAIFKSGKDIFVLSTPGRNAAHLGNYLENHAGTYNISFKKDTIYANRYRNEYLICYRNKSGWNTINQYSCGFENAYDGIIYTDKGSGKLEGSGKRDNRVACNGIFSLQLDSQSPESPRFEIKSVKPDDYFELTVKRKKNPDFRDNDFALCLESTRFSDDSLRFTISKPLISISEDWELVRLNVRIPDSVDSTTLIASVKVNNNTLCHIDDFTYKQMRNISD